MARRAARPEDFRAQALAAARAVPGFDAPTLETHLDFLRTTTLFWSLFEKRLRSYGFTPPQMKVMSLLRLRGAEGISLSRVGDWLCVTRAGVTGVVDTLERRGWARRRPHPEDRRITLLSLTPKGSAHIRRILPGHFRFLRRIYGGLNAGEKRRLARLLEKLWAPVAAGKVDVR